jgi:hypothetical protein
MGLLFRICEAIGQHKIDLQGVWTLVLLLEEFGQVQMSACCAWLSENESGF